MKQTLLFIFSWILFIEARAQVKPPAEPVSVKLKRNGEITREPENEEKNVSIYPNPTSGIVNLSLSGFSGKRTTLSVVNVIGTVVHRETLSNIDDHYTKTLDLSKFANGLYYIKLEADDYSEIRKVVLK